MINSMKQKHEISGRYFTFEILTDGGYIDVNLRSKAHGGLEYQPVDKDELKELANFINRYLDKPK
jgi:hypothetical protein